MVGNAATGGKVTLHRGACWVTLYNRLWSRRCKNDFVQWCEMRISYCGVGSCMVHLGCSANAVWVACTVVSMAKEALAHTGGCMGQLWVD